MMRWPGIGRPAHAILVPAVLLVGLLSAATGTDHAVAQSAGERSPETQANTDLQLGLIASLSAHLADSLYGRCLPAFSAAKQGVDLSSPLDAYYTGLLQLRRLEFAQAQSTLRKVDGRGGSSKGIPAPIQSRARLLGGACDAWARGETPATPAEPEDAALLEAWTMCLSGRWPDPARLGKAAGGTPIRKLMLALAARETEAVRAAVTDRKLYAVDYPETRAEGGREFIDPLPVLLAAKGYYFLAEEGYLKAAGGGRSTHLDGAAFAALLAGDSKSLAMIVERDAAASLQCYRSALPGKGSGDGTALQASSDDSGVELAQARVLGFALRDSRSCLDRYGHLVSVGKEAAKAIPLRREATVACLVLEEYPTAFRYGDGLWQRDHNDPVGIVARSYADLGREEFLNFGAAALLQENLTVPGGLCEKFAFLNALKVTTRLYVTLHSPIDQQGAGVK